jgi:glycosyltransferase involved in cell wall biosynthesis
VSNQKNIFLISSHPPIDSELIDVWLSDSYNVNMITHRYTWNEQFASLDKRVNVGIPKHKPDLIICESNPDLRLALMIKFKKLWFNLDVIKYNLWYPDKSIFLRFSKNVSVCEYAKKVLMTRDKISSKVVFCPVDTEFFTRLNVRKRKKAIAIGNNFKGRGNMGFSHLIAILNKVHEMDREIELSVIGDNNKEDYPEFVEVKSLPKEEIKIEINNSKCVFFTTTYNLIMNSMQIAMSCEAAVVAFDLEPFREVIENGKSGFLVPKFDDDYFAKQIVNLCSNDDFETIGKFTRQSIVEKCDKWKVARSLLEI